MDGLVKLNDPVGPTAAPIDKEVRRIHRWWFLLSSSSSSFRQDEDATSLPRRRCHRARRQGNDLDDLSTAATSKRSDRSEEATSMAAASTGGEDDCPSSSFSASLSSPKNSRLKFLCSFGGKILPRPSDGRLKYVGGDTRVLVVTRAVSFSELRERIQAMFRRCKVIKYQLVSEDLDTLVTVAGDEDLAHMLDEYDRVDALHPRSPSAVSSPRFRLFLFLFPSPSSASDAASAATLGQRYVDAINAVIPGSPPVLSISNVSSGANSPTSATDCSGAFFASRPVALGSGGMHRVQSLPDLADRRTLNPTGGAGLQHHQNLRHHHHLHHPAQHHHLPHRQPTPALQPHVAGGSGVWRPGPAPRHEASGYFVPRGSLYYGGGGSVPLRSACEESHSGRASRSTSPFRTVPREPVIWE